MISQLPTLQNTGHTVAGAFKWVTFHFDLETAPQLIMLTKRVSDTRNVTSVLNEILQMESVSQKRLDIGSQQKLMQ